MLYLVYTNTIPHLVDKRHIAVSGDETSSDPLNLVRAGRTTGKHRRLHGLHCTHLEEDGPHVSFEEVCSFTTGGERNQLE